MVNLPNSPVRPPETSIKLTQNDNNRFTHTYDRRLFMEGGWEVEANNYVWARLNDHVLRGTIRADTSHNIFRDTVNRISTRYEVPPTVSPPLEGDDIWYKHMMVEQYSNAYNAAIVVVRADTDSNKLVITVLPPDHADAAFTELGVPNRVRVAIPAIGMASWRVLEWDLSGPTPTYRTLDNGVWKASDSYPWKFSDGKPFIPVEIYRASDPPDWWGGNCKNELIVATLEEALAWTVHSIGCLNGSTGIPYTMDAEALGAEPDGDGDGSAHAAGGPNVVLQLRSLPNAKAAAAGVLQPTFDPQKSVESIRAAYNARMDSMGIGEGALQRSGAESGYAIQVRREGLVRLRTMTEREFSSSDASFVRKVVAMRRLFLGGPAEEASYRVSYAAPAGGSADQRERRDQEKHDLDIGVATPVSILAAREGISLEDARAKLASYQANTDGTEV